MKKQVKKELNSPDKSSYIKERRYTQNTIKVKAIPKIIEQHLTKYRQQKNAKVQAELLSP